MPTHSALGVTASLKVTDLHASLSRGIDLNQGSEYRDSTKRIDNLLENGERLLERPVQITNGVSDENAQLLGPNGDTPFFMVEASTLGRLKAADINKSTLAAFQGTSPGLKKSSDHTVPLSGALRLPMRPAPGSQAAKRKAKPTDVDVNGDCCETGDDPTDHRDPALTSPDKVTATNINEGDATFGNHFGTQPDSDSSLTSIGSSPMLTPSKGVFASSPQKSLTDPVRLSGSSTSKLAQSRRAKDAASPSTDSKRKYSEITSSVPPFSTPHSVNNTSQQALALAINILPETFLPLESSQKPGDLKIEVFLNGSLVGVAFVAARLASALKGIGGLQLFSGTRMHRQTEKPWTYERGSHEKPPTTAGQGKWAVIADALKREALARGHDSSGDTSVSAKYLAAVAGLPLPTHLQEEDHNLGIMDVVITAGIGKKHGPDTAYLTKPTRMDDKRFRSTDTSITKPKLPSFSDVFGIGGLSFASPEPLPQPALSDSASFELPAMETPPPKWPLSQEEQPTSPTPTGDRFRGPLVKAGGIPWKLLKLDLRKTKVTHKNRKGEKSTRTIGQYLSDISKKNVDKQLEAWEDLQGSMEPDIVEAIEKLTGEEDCEVMATPSKAPGAAGRVESAQAVAGSAASANMADLDRMETTSAAPNSFGTFAPDAMDVFMEDAPHQNTEGPMAINPPSTSKALDESATVNPRLTSQTIGHEASGPSALERVEDWYNYQLKCASNGRFALDGYGNNCMARLVDMHDTIGFHAHEVYCQTWFIWQATTKRKQANSTMDPKLDFFGLKGPDAKLFFKTVEELKNRPPTTQDRVQLALSYGANMDGPLVSYLKGLKPTKLPTADEVKTTGLGKKQSNRAGRKAPAPKANSILGSTTTTSPYKTSHNVSALAGSPMKVAVKRKGTAMPAAPEPSDTPNKRRRTRNVLEDTPVSAANASAGRSITRSGAMAPPATPSRPPPETPSKSRLGSTRSRNRWNPNELTHTEADEAFVVPEECDGSVLGYAKEGMRQINKARNGEFREEKVVVGMRFILV
ncbi:hypothetical protein MBLNU230_g5534t1 [Neophaeotheca triangularis]